MTTILEVASFLQIPWKGRSLRSALEYLDCVEVGLPTRCLHQIVNVIAPGDVKFKYRVAPKATLDRKRRHGHLTKVQSEIVTRLAQVWLESIRAWKQEDDARNFLNRKHPMLENRRPIDIALRSAIGAELVRDILAQLEHSSAV